MFSSFGFCFKNYDLHSSWDIRLTKKKRMVGPIFGRNRKQFLPYTFRKIVSLRSLVISNALRCKLNVEYILKIQQAEVNNLEFSKFSKLILSFFVRERIKITQTNNKNWKCNGIHDCNDQSLRFFLWSLFFSMIGFFFLTQLCKCFRTEYLIGVSGIINMELCFCWKCNCIKYDWIQHKTTCKTYFVRVVRNFCYSC